MEFGGDEPVEIHRDCGETDRMVFAENGETDELEELVILRLPSSLAFLDRARHHAAD